MARYFNDASRHKDHGHRIAVAEARRQGLDVEQLEDSQPLQEAVLTAYHLMTISIEHGPIAKLMWSDTGHPWMKTWIPPRQVVRAWDGSEP